MEVLMHTHEIINGCGSCLPVPWGGNVGTEVNKRWGWEGALVTISHALYGVMGCDAHVGNTRMQFYSR